MSAYASHIVLLQRHFDKAAGAPAVRKDHAAAEDGHGHAPALMQLLQLHLARPLAAAVPACMLAHALSPCIFILPSSPHVLIKSAAFAGKHNGMHLMEKNWKLCAKQ